MVPLCRRCRRPCRPPAKSLPAPVGQQATSALRQHAPRPLPGAERSPVVRCRRVCTAAGPGGHVHLHRDAKPIWLSFGERCGTRRWPPAGATAAAAAWGGAAPTPLPPTFHNRVYASLLPPGTCRTLPWCCWTAHRSSLSLPAPAAPRAAAAAARRHAAPSSGWRLRCAMFMKLTAAARRLQRCGGAAGSSCMGLPLLRR